MGVRGSFWLWRVAVAGVVVCSFGLLWNISVNMPDHGRDVLVRPARDPSALFGDAKAADAAELPEGAAVSDPEDPPTGALGGGLANVISGQAIHGPADPDFGAFTALVQRVFPAETAACIQVLFSADPPASITASLGPDPAGTKRYFSIRLAVPVGIAGGALGGAAAVGECSRSTALEITADGVHSAASAVHHYCFHSAACTISWGQRKKPAFPRALPAVAPLDDPNQPPATAVVSRRPVLPHAYYMNFCTPSYTMAFWEWERWERELDWMAIHGITMPLIILGREVVMLKLFTERGMSDPEVRAFFGGPAFLAWHRMGNLKAFAGPLPVSYLRYAERLTTQVLTRARALGMTPILPGFSGHVPDELERRIPDGKFSRLPTWSGFPREFSALLFVEPTSALYTELGKRFIEIQTEMFGTDHFYAVDQFNENDPRTTDVEYLTNCGKAQYDSLRGGDPQATWVMQGWLFVFHSKFWGPPQIAAYMAAVPNDRMIVLDLISEATPAYEQTDSYHNKPYIWSVLHNFGGQIGLRGNLETVMKRPYEAAVMPKSTQVGIGLTMEAINQNPIMYELALDHMWNAKPRDLAGWVTRWAMSRYGIAAAMGRGRGSQNTSEAVAATALTRAWLELLHSCYNVMDHSQGNGFWGVTRSIIEKRPTINPDRAITSGFQGTRLQYDSCKVFDAWGLFLDAIKAMAPSKGDGLHFSGLVGTTLELDAVDLTRQVLSNHAQVLYLRFTAQVKGCGVDSASKAAATRDELLQLIDDLDALLCMVPYFSFELWESSAQNLTCAASASCGGDGADAEKEKALYAYNARNLVTMWGPNGQIGDYSSRLWGGLIGSYYRERWATALGSAVEFCSAGSNKGKTPGDNFAGTRIISEFERAWQRNAPGSGYTPRCKAASKNGAGVLIVVTELHEQYSGSVFKGCKESK